VNHRPNLRHNEERQDVKENDCQDKQKIEQTLSVGWNHRHGRINNDVEANSKFKFQYLERMAQQPSEPWPTMQDEER
jgi:hypothetical protein